MDTEALIGDLTAELSRRLKRSQVQVPIGVSNRHAHVTQEHFKILFGSSAALSRLRDLKQVGQYAANEKIDIVGPKGTLRGVRLLGPCRSKTQAEISMTDAIVLGVKAPVRESGDLARSSSLRLVGPQGSVEVKEGLIIAHRHLHASTAEAAALGVSNGEVVRARVGRSGERETIFEAVVVRVSDQFRLELHLDTDEANAAGVANGDAAYIV